MKPADLLIFAIPVLLLVFMFSAQRKRQRAFGDLQSRVEPGQEVLTTAGLYARVVSVDDAVVVLETGPGQTVRWDRRAIASIVARPTAGEVPTVSPQALASAPDPLPPSGSPPSGDLDPDRPPTEK